MLNLYTTSIKKESLASTLTDQEKVSVKYHDLFDYPLNLSELIKWQVGNGFGVSKLEFGISKKNGFYFMENRSGLFYKRLLRKRISAKKMQHARNAARFLKFIPTIKMVAVTGSLAMLNASSDSDIDLMIVTKRGLLWTTRILVYLLLRVGKFATRTPSDKDQKDKLCLNIWLDEKDLIWKKKNRNLYTSHEIAQIVPLVNKDRVYEEFLYKNKWILGYWPNAVRVRKLHSYRVTETKKLFYFVTLSLCNYITSFLEKMAFKVQYQNMKPKITREVVTPTRALFHPQDWGEVVLNRLST